MTLNFDFAFHNVTIMILHFTSELITVVDTVVVNFVFRSHNVTTLHSFYFKLRLKRAGEEKHKDLQRDALSCNLNLRILKSFF